MVYRSDHPGDPFASDLGFRGAWARLFSQGENPVYWSAPLFVFRGIMVRLSLLFILYFISELLSSRAGWRYTSIELACLFTMVLVHEFGHCFACRWTGGEADHILLWPLGGLAMCRPPHHWRANFITTAGGPLVNVALIPVLGVPVYLMTHTWSSVLFNPFKSIDTLSALNFSSYWQVLLWWTYCTNLILLIFNLCVPMFPLDGARLAQELLWSRIGYRKSMGIMVTVGFAPALVMGFLAMVTKDTTLVGIAIFGGFTCYAERQRLAMISDLDDLDPGYPSFRSSLEPDFSSPRVRAEEPGPSKAELKRRAKREAQATAEQDELDRILAKIAKDGMASLTKKEQQWLRDATERRRAN